MEPETLYPSGLAIYDPIKKCGQIFEHSILRRSFESVDGGFLSITKATKNSSVAWLCRTSVTLQSISASNLTSRFFRETIVDGELISGTRVTVSRLAQLARTNNNLRIDIQSLARAEEGYLIICNAAGLNEQKTVAEMRAAARSLPAFVGFFTDDEDAVGVVVGEASTEAVAFKLRWG